MSARRPGRPRRRSDRGGPDHRGGRAAGTTSARDTASTGRTTASGPTRRHRGRRPAAQRRHLRSCSAPARRRSPGAPGRRATRRGRPAASDAPDARRRAAFTPAGPADPERSRAPTTPATPQSPAAAHSTRRSSVGGTGPAVRRRPAAGTTAGGGPAGRPERRAGGRRGRGAGGRRAGSGHGDGRRPPRRAATTAGAAAPVARPRPTARPVPAAGPNGTLPRPAGAAARSVRGAARRSRAERPVARHRPARRRRRPPHRRPVRTRHRCPSSRSPPARRTAELGRPQRRDGSAPHDGARTATPVDRDAVDLRRRRAVPAPARPQATACSPRACPRSPSRKGCRGRGGRSPRPGAVRSTSPRPRRSSPRSRPPGSPRTARFRSTGSWASGPTTTCVPVSAPVPADTARAARRPGAFGPGTCTCRGPAPATDPAGHAFATIADEGWRAASGAAAERPDELTAAGLPKRRPRARLVPGSAGSAVLAAPASPTRSAESVRGRLASYQQGVRQGREIRLRRDPGRPGPSRSRPGRHRRLRGAAGTTRKPDDRARGSGPHRTGGQRPARCSKEGA